MKRIEIVEIDELDPTTGKNLLIGLALNPFEKLYYDEATDHVVYEYEAVGGTTRMVFRNWTHYTEQERE